MLAQKGEGWVKTLEMCKTPLWLGRTVSFQPGAAAPLSVESRDTVPPMIATAVTGITGSRDSAHASDGAGSRLSASSSQELSVPDIQYPQGERDFCAFFGLASAPHHSGMLAQAKELIDIAQASLAGELRESSAGPAEDGSGAGPPAPRAASPAGQRRGCSTSILPQCVSPAGRAGDGPGADAPRAGDSPGADVSRAAIPLGRVHAARFLSIPSRVTPLGPSVGSAPAGSSPQPGDSRRVTRARGGGEPEEDGVPPRTRA